MTSTQVKLDAWFCQNEKQANEQQQNSQDFRTSQYKAELEFTFLLTIFIHLFLFKIVHTSCSLFSSSLFKHTEIPQNRKKQLSNNTSMQ